MQIILCLPFVKGDLFLANLVCVDDIIVVDSNSDACYNSIGLFLSQQKYAQEPTNQHW